LKRTAKHIDSALRSLHGMLEIMITLSQIEAGLLLAASRPCDLADLFEPIKLETTALAAARNLRLTFAAPEGMVRSHPKLLAAAARSLVLNAIEFAGGGDISFASRRRGDTLRLEVAFEGTRIDAEIGKRAFVQLAPPHNGSADSVLGLGPVLLDHVCRVLGCTFEHGQPSPERRQLTIVLPATGTSR
jgi:two-component system CheB/CheR fusion protein